MLATGALSAAATYRTPGGTSPPSITLKLVTGADSTGARDVLVSMWNQANPQTTVVVTEVGGETEDQKHAMVSAVQNGDADILNMDIIHIAYFQANGLISPIESGDVDEFLRMPVTQSVLGDAGPVLRWAVPFNADVGMLFERRATGQALPKEPGLAGVIDGVPDGSGWFAGQLKSSLSTSAEVFTVNVLEHALSRDAKLLENGMPVRQLERWQSALEPLRVAIDRERLTLCDGATDTRDRFRTLRLPYMRNWPVAYRELKQSDDPDALASQISVRSLPLGILGGQSLALAETSNEQSRAEEVIRFLTSGPAQRILAAYGLAPTKAEAYNDRALLTFIPHLKELRSAVEHSVPRPWHPNYDAASQVVVEHSQKLLEQGEDLTMQFIDELQAALS